MVPGDRHSFRIETGGQPVEPIGPIHVVLDILLAGPHDFHWTVDMLGDLDGAGDVIGLQPPAEPSAEQMVVDHDLVQRQVRGLGHRRLGARHDLAAEPDLAAVLAQMNRAVHRLHRGVGEERHLVGRLDLGDGARHCLVDIAGILRHRSSPERGLLELSRRSRRC